MRIRGNDKFLTLPKVNLRGYFLGEKIKKKCVNNNKKG